MNFSTKQSQIAVTTSGTTLQIVKTPTRKLLAMVRKESPVVRYLKERENKIENKQCYKCRLQSHISKYKFIILAFVTYSLIFIFFTVKQQQA